jgi:hypothetical protein
MKVDVEDVLFWMDAIRNSSDRFRTLESFWKGQVRSKIWLIENLKQFAKFTPNTIVVHGGWNGVLSSLLFNSDIPVEHITSVDLDPNCEDIAHTVNKRQEIEGNFCAITQDMKDFDYDRKPDIVINTSAEHVSDAVLTEWFTKIPKNTLVAIQSNDFFDLQEHVNCVNSAEELFEKFSLANSRCYSFKTEKYTRYMVIGYA